MFKMQMSAAGILVNLKTLTAICSLVLMLLFASSLKADVGDLVASFGDVADGISADGFYNGEAKSYDILLQSDGKVITIGYCENGNNQDICLARFNSDGSIDTAFGDDGIVKTKNTCGDNDAGIKGVLQSDGKIVVVGGTDSAGVSKTCVLRYNTDGSLDTDFGTDGITTTDISGAGHQNAPQAVLIDGNGNIVIAGYVDNGSDLDFFIARYTSAGVLDGTFGTNGITTTDFSGDYDRAYDIVMQSDNKFVVGGYADNSSGISEFALARYSNSGSLDTTYGTSGKVTTAFNGQDDTCYAIDIDDDDSIVATGYAQVGASEYSVALAKYSSTGALDATFGSGGKVTTSIGSLMDIALDITIQSDHTILVAGINYTTASTSDLAVLKYTSAGALDTTFDSDGIATTNIIGASVEVAYGIAVKSDGTIYLTGAAASTYPVLVVSFDSTGALNTSFDTDGKVTEEVGSAWSLANAMVMQGDGKVIQAGYAADMALGKYVFALQRYDTNGGLDATFGTEGQATTAASSDSSSALAVALQSDGKIVAVGYAYDGSDYDFAIVRYNDDGSLDTGFGASGIKTIDVSGASREDVATSVVIQSDGKIVVGGYSYDGSKNLFALVRLSGTDGSLDTSFDTDGIVTTAADTNNSRITGLALDSSGDIYAGGYAENGSNRYQFAVAKYDHTDGSLDTTFDTDGIQTASNPAIVSKNDYGNAITIQSDGKILLGGYTKLTSQTNFAVVRFNTDGSLDTSFDTDGMAFTDLDSSSYDYATSIMVQPNGKIVVGGYTGSGVSSDLHNYAFVRYDDSDGSVDASQIYSSSCYLKAPIDSTVNVTPDVPCRSGVLKGKYLYLGGNAEGDFIVAKIDLNSPPDIGISGVILPYTAGDGATRVAEPFTDGASDPDGDADWDGGTLKVQITENDEATDELSMPDGTIGVINTSGLLLKDGPLTIGTLSVPEGTVTGGTPLLITFNSNATNTNVTQTINSICFRSTSSDPDNTPRIVKFTVTDRANASASDTRTIGIKKPPVVTTDAASDITTTTATGNGNITLLGVDNPTEHGVCWSTSADPEVTDNKTSDGAVSATGTFTSSITGLSDGTTYHVRAYATNTDGTGYGDDVTFRTKDYTVTFATDGTAGASLTGDTTQYIDDGTNCTSVTAVAPDGYELSSWSGTGGFTSTDNPMTVTNVTKDMTITANFTPTTLTFVASDITVTENSTNNIQIKLSGVPANDIDVSVGRTSGDTDLTGSGSLTFTSANWDTYQDVAISAADDADAVNSTAVFTITKDSGLNPIADKDVTVSEADDELPVVNLSVDPSSIDENGGVATLTATLDSTFTSDVTVNLAFSGTATGSGTDYTASASQIVVSAGNTTGTMTITGVDDALSEGDETVIVDVDSVTNGREATEQQVTVTITDDELYTLTVENGVGAGTKYKDDVVTIGAVVPPGYEFTSWTDDVGGTFADSTSSTTTYTMPGSNATVTANFTAIEGNLMMTGDNTYHQLGDGTTTNVSTPFELLESSVNMIADRDAHSSWIVKTDGSLWAWGSSSRGELGGGSQPSQETPLQIISSGVSSVFSGGNCSFIIKTDGSIWATGNNSKGQLGDGTTDNKSSFSQVLAAGSGVKFISSMAGHTLFLKDDGSVWACGDNSYGELGDGTTTDSTSLKQIVSSDAVAVAAGEHFSLILKSDGSVWSCGINDYGQLGDGTQTNNITLKKADISGVKNISAGLSKSLFLKTDGTVWGCGYGNGMGVNATVFTTTPIQLTTKIAEYINAAEMHSFFIATDGSLWGDGSNYSGQLGNGTTTSTADYEEIYSRDVLAVACSETHTMIMKNLYSLTVSTTGTGIGDGSYMGGEVVSISTTLPSGYDFATWTTSDGGSFDDATAASTTYTMPFADATVTANFTPTPLTVIASDISVDEGSSNNIQVKLSAQPADTIVLSISRTSGDTDLTGSGTLSFTTANWDTYQNFAVSAAEDGDRSCDSAVFTITKSSGTNPVTEKDVTVTEIDNDLPIVTLSVDSATIAEAGGAATVTATLDSIFTSDVTVDLAITGTASSAGVVDYTISSTTIVIPAGDTTGTVTVTANQDSFDEDDETVILDINSVTNARETTPQQVTVIITDDDPAPGISIDDVTVTEGDTGITTATFTVALSAASEKTVTVDYATTDGTATTADNDYNSDSGTLTFNPGDTSKTIDVTVNGDYNDEDNEQFTVVLSGPVNASITDTTGTGTITDDDAIKITYGTILTLDAADVSEIDAEFSKRPSFYGKYTDPVKSKDSTVAMKTLTKVSTTQLCDNVQYEWTRTVYLYDKSGLSKDNKTGMSTKAWLTINPISDLDCALWLKTTNVDKLKKEKTFRGVLLTPPTITSVTGWDGSTITTGVHAGGNIIVNGTYFGSKPPTVSLEYTDKNAKIKQKRLKVLSVYDYKDDKGNDNKSCMDLDETSGTYGVSKIRVEMPKKWWTEWETDASHTYSLLLSNKIGITTYDILTVDTTTDTIPSAKDDAVTLVAGSSYYYINIFADNGNGVDTDADSDTMTVSFADNGKLASGGKVTYDKNQLKVKYAPPHSYDASAGFTDTFTYTLSDGISAATSTATVTVTINPISVTSVTKWDGTALGDVQENSHVIITGTDFGVNAPTVSLKYIDAKGNNVLQKLKVVSTAQYKDYNAKANSSYTDVDPDSATFRKSEITVEMPSSWWSGWSAGSYTLQIDNKCDKDESQTLSTVTDESGDTAPVSKDDDITIYSGSKYYYLDVLADNGNGVDTDAESDVCQIVLDQKKSDQGGTIKYDTKTNTIKYTRPKVTATTLAQFTDHFQYHLQDNSKTDGNIVDVDITIKLNP